MRRIRLMGIRVLLLCVGFLIASCSYSTGLFRALSSSETQTPAPTRIVITSTPAPQVPGIAQRINIPAGGNSTQVSGQIDGTVFDTYVLDVRAGLRMQISLTSSGSNVYLTVVSPTGTPLARAEAGAQSFDQVLTESGDYSIKVSAPAGTSLTSYTLAVTVTDPQPAQPSVQRIRFATGATSAQVSGQVDGNTPASYVLEAQAGQRMQVNVTSPASNVYLTVVSPGGSPLARAQAGAQSMDQTLPESGDYSLQVSAFAGTLLTSYTVNITITGGQPPQPPQPSPQRIRFATGATSAQVSGQIGASAFISYVLEARAGQQMVAYVTSPASNVYLTVVSPGGSPLARAQAGAQSMDQTLPESGDYTLQVSTFPGTTLTSYTLTVSVTSGQTQQPAPQRIHFAPGATSAQVSGSVDGTIRQTYLLEASAGQRMQVYVTSPASNVYLTVVSPGGSPLARAQAGAQSMDQTLPESGDYRLEVSAFSGTALTTYTLNVTVTGSQPPPPATQRIRFATGATSAQVSRQVNGTIYQTYLLEARAGQHMQVYVTSPASNVYLTVVSPLGSPLARAQAGAQSMDDILPESGDYTLQVSAPAGTALTSYTLYVSVTG